MAILSTAISSLQNWVKGNGLQDASKLAQSVRVGAAAGIALTWGTSVFLDIHQTYLSNVEYYLPCESRKNGVLKGFLATALIAPVLQELFFRVTVQGLIKRILPQDEDKKINLGSGYRVKAATLVSIALTALAYTSVYFSKFMNGIPYEHQNGNISTKIVHLIGNFVSGIIYGALKEKLGLIASLTANVAYHGFAHLEVCRIFWLCKNPLKNVGTSIIKIDPVTLGYIASCIALAIPNSTWKNMAIAGLPLEDSRSNNESKSLDLENPKKDKTNRLHAALKIIQPIAIGISAGIAAKLGTEIIWKLAQNFYKGPIFFFIHPNEKSNDNLSLYDLLDKRLIASAEIREETESRGIMQESIKLGVCKILEALNLLSPEKTKTASLVISIASSALFFGRTHYKGYENFIIGKYRVIGTIFSGVIYGIVKERFGLRASIASHLTYNLMAEFSKYVVFKTVFDAIQADASKGMNGNGIVYILNDKFFNSVYVIRLLIPSIISRFLPQIELQTMTKQEAEYWMARMEDSTSLIQE